MRDYHDTPDADKPQLTREDLKTMRPQDVVQAQKDGRLRDITSIEDRRIGPQGKHFGRIVQAQKDARSGRN